MNHVKEKIHALCAKPGARLKLLGDSITHGVGGAGFCQDGEKIVEEFSRNPNGYCWANLFCAYMESQKGVTVTNNACTGTNIQFILKHFDALVDEEDDLVLCIIGTNNRHCASTVERRPEKEEHGAVFAECISKLYEKFKAKNKEVIFVSNIPASAQNEQDGEGYFRILNMSDINTIYKRCSEKMGFDHISLYDRMVEHCQACGEEIDAFLSDGLHPNDRGHESIFALMKQALFLDA